MRWRDLLQGPGPAPDTYAVQGPDLSISDPALAAWIGRTVDPKALDADPLTVPAYWRVKALIAGTCAGLPLKTYTKSRAGVVTRVPSFLDDPAGPYAGGGLTAFKWKEIVYGHLFEDGETFLEHVYSAAGALIGLLPTCADQVVAVRWLPDATKEFDVQRKGGKVTYTSRTMTQVIGFGDSTLRGESFAQRMKRVATTSVAGDISASKSFRGANKVLVSTEEDVDEDDSKAIVAGLDARLDDESKRLAFVNRQLKLSPFDVNPKDAQHLESRQFQVEEWARAAGVPTNLLSVTGAVSNWGTGVAEANLGLQKYTLASYTDRVEEALSRLLPKAQYCEVDYKALLQGTPAQEIELLIAQVAAGILTTDEAREFLGKAPLPKPKIVPAAPAPVAKVV